MRFTNYVNALNKINKSSLHSIFYTFLLLLSPISSNNFISLTSYIPSILFLLEKDEPRFTLAQTSKTECSDIYNFKTVSAKKKGSNLEVSDRQSAYLSCLSFLREYIFLFSVTGEIFKIFQILSNC